MDEASETNSTTSFMQSEGSPYEPSHERGADEAERIANDESMDEKDKIDVLARIIDADTEPIDEYLSGNATVEETAELLAKPIDEAFSTGDHGHLYYESEQVARNQRKYHSAEEALEMWGPEQDFPEPSAETKELPSTEGQLWRLWFAVLHAAKRIPWTDGAQQTKLLGLVQALKARANPAMPPNMTKAMHRDWIWDSGDLWSSLIMLGPSARETWNDSPGCGAGWTAPEQRAWANVNAFVARLTASETADFSLYAQWALRDALEYKPGSQASHKSAPVIVQLQFSVNTAAVWVVVAGEYLYGKREMDDEGVDGEALDIRLRDKKLPWNGTVTNARWVFWRRRFQQEAQNEKLAQETRDLAARAADLICKWEKEGRTD